MMCTSPSNKTRLTVCPSISKWTARFPTPGLNETGDLTSPERAIREEATQSRPAGQGLVLYSALIRSNPEQSFRSIWNKIALVPEGEKWGWVRSLSHSQDIPALDVSTKVTAWGTPVLRLDTLRDFSRPPGCLRQASVPGVWSSRSLTPLPSTHADRMPAGFKVRVGGPAISLQDCETGRAAPLHSAHLRLAPVRVKETASANRPCPRFQFRISPSAPTGNTPPHKPSE